MPPYSELTRAHKLTFARALSATDDEMIDLFFDMKAHITCCAGARTLRPWCSCSGFNPILPPTPTLSPTPTLPLTRCPHMDGLDRKGVSDHMCRITRQRLGFSSSNLTMPRSAYAPAVFERATRGNVTRYSWPEYKVPTVRADSLWRRHLERHPTSPRRIDFLKIDVDRPWHTLGLEGLFSARAFKVLVIECDNSWDGGAAFRAWGVSTADQLAWVARMHGYDTFIKVPCQATAAAKSCASRIGPSERPAAHIPRPHCWLDAVDSSWYYPIATAAPSVRSRWSGWPLRRGGGTSGAANPASGFVPTALVVAAMGGNIQDLLVVDAREPGLVEHLTSRGATECVPDAASREAFKQGVAWAPGGGGGAPESRHDRAAYRASPEGREQLRAGRSEAKLKAAALASKRRVV